ncbi:hypothetical protein F4776DRAFT_283804 [Hypoxylon sp. NC0597]|nr:hypothetical protein F4776DRAFT_283804 [Hypoxylon sp. NC0597]
MLDSTLDLSTPNDRYLFQSYYLEVCSYLAIPDNKINVLRLYRGLNLAYLGMSEYHHCATS